MCVCVCLVFLVGEGTRNSEIRLISIQALGSKLNMATLSVLRGLTYWVSEN